MQEVLHLLHTFCFYENNIFYYLPYYCCRILFLLKINIMETTPLKIKRGFPIKTFQSKLHMCYRLFYCMVCISIVRLNRYLIKYMIAQLCICLHGNI